MKLSLRIPLMFVALMLLAVGSVAGISSWRTGTALEEQARERLTGFRETRAAAVERFLEELEARMVSIATTPSTEEALREFSFALPFVDNDVSKARDILLNLNASGGLNDPDAGVPAEQAERTSHYRDVHGLYHRYF